MSTFSIPQPINSSMTSPDASTIITELKAPETTFKPDNVLEDIQDTLDMFPQMAWAMRCDGVTEYFNSAWRSYTGIQPEASATNWLYWAHPDDPIPSMEQWMNSPEMGAPLDLECRLRHKSGEFRWFLIMICAQRNKCGEVVRWLGSCTDIHKQRARQSVLEDNINLQQDMLDASVDCIKVIHPDGRLSAMNKSGCIALGIPEHSEFGMDWLNLLPQQVRRRGGRALAIARKGRMARFPGMSQLPGHKPQYWDNVLTPLKDTAGQTAAILCVSREVTLQREAELRLRIASEIDSLTGLFNRRSCKARLKRLIRSARQSGRQFGLLLVDLDHFKQINDSLGHPAGDHLLKIISRRLKSRFSDTGFVARIGGDEFVIVVDKVSDEKALHSAAEQALSQMEIPIHYNSNQINGGMSIGGAMFPRDAKDIESLARCCDVALSDLKANGRGGFRMFDVRMTKRSEQVTAQLRLAAQIVRHHAVEPRYQPKIQLDDCSMVGFEALLSWRCPETGLQPSSSIAEAYKDYESATRLSCMLHEKVLMNMAAWQERGLRLLPVSINAAPAEFLRGDFAECFLMRLERFRIPFSLIEIEITEHTLFARSSEFVVRALEKLRRHGVRISLDNFGTGYSTLAKLGEYPVDGLKIDQSFVQRMANERSVLAIIQAIESLGSSLSLEVVAKGIETKRQCKILRGLGCKVGQGLHFGPLLSPEQVASRLIGKSA